MTLPKGPRCRRFLSGLTGSRSRALAWWLALLLSLGGGSGVEAGADQSGELGELARIRERIESREKSRGELRSRTEVLDQEIADIERSLGRINLTIDRLEADVAARGQRIGELARDRTRLEATMTTHRRAIVSHARAAYAAGRQDWLKLLLNQEDPSRLARVLAYHSYFNRARGLEIRALAEEMQEGRRLQGELSAETEKLRGAQRQLANQQVALKQGMATRRQLLAGLNEEIRVTDGELGRLREDESRLQELIESLRRQAEEAARAPGTAVTKLPLPVPGGRSTCPVAGRVAASFGGPKGVGHWDGIVIDVAEGTPVKAVAPGQVVFSDWMRGYGLMTIIDHGNGVMSLYAFNQSLYKGLGDGVAAGEAVAAVGASGGRAVPGLYFGIREQGKAVDPTPWCRDKPRPVPE